MSRYDSEPQARTEVIRELVRAKFRFDIRCARAAGIPNSTLHSILTGHRNGTRETLEKIAAALGVDLSVIAEERIDDQAEAAA